MGGQKKQRGGADAGSVPAWPAVRKELAELEARLRLRLPELAMLGSEQSPRPSSALDVGSADDLRDVEGLLALRIAEVVLRPDSSGAPVGEVHHLLDNLEVVARARADAEDRDALEKRQRWELENHESSVIQDFLQEEDLAHYTNAHVRMITGEPTSALHHLVAPIAQPPAVTMADLITSFGRLLESPDPDDHVSTYHRAMDLRWRALSRDYRRRIRDDVHRSILFWKLAAPALAHHERPGVLSALTFGVQLPLDGDADAPIRRSSIYKSLGNLRDAWAVVMTVDPSAAQWAALFLSLPARPDDAREAILALCSPDEWRGTPGRKAHRQGEAFSVSKWTCDVCDEAFEPGNHQHDSPHAVHVAASVENERNAYYRTSGRVLKGLPATAQPWQRLMCGIRQEDVLCWSRGGVLTPHR